jgi:hypothetical protein
MALSQPFSRTGRSDLEQQADKGSTEFLTIPEEECGTLSRSRATHWKKDSHATVPIHFLHIRKTGGTAVAEALRPVARCYGLVLHDHSTTLSDIPVSDKVVFFVRHPISRYVSGFYSRLRRGLPRHYYDWTENEARAFRRFQTANHLAEALTSSDPEVGAHAREAMQSVRHINTSCGDWLGGAKELDRRFDSILLIGLQETLHSDFEYLKKELSLPETLSLPEDNVLAHRTPTEFDRWLSPLAEHNLLKWYAKDVHFYELCLELRTKRGPR